MVLPEESTDHLIELLRSHQVVQHRPVPGQEVDRHRAVLQKLERSRGDVHTPGGSEAREGV